MKFKPKGASGPQTYFVAGQALYLGPDEEFETDDQGLVAELKAHDGFAEVKASKAAKAKDKDKS